jgi:histidine ammonia-lyase
MSIGSSGAIGGRNLNAGEIDALAHGHVVAHLDPGVQSRVERSHAFVQRLASAGVPVYGLTTGCGPLAGQAIPAESRPLQQSVEITVGTLA